MKILKFEKDNENGDDGKNIINYGRRRESNGDYRITFTNNAKKTIRNRNYSNMQKKIDQVVYEDSNSQKIVKYLTNPQIDPSRLMQPKFSCSDAKYASVWKKQNIKTITREELNRLGSDLKEISLNNDSIFPQKLEVSFSSYRPQIEEDITERERNNFRMNLSKLLQAKEDDSPIKSKKECKSPKIQLTVSERSQLMRIAKGQNNEEEREQDIQPQKEFLTTSPSLFKQKSRPISSHDRFKNFSQIENLMNKKEQDLVFGSSSLPSSPKMTFFTTVKEMKSTAPQKFTLQTGQETYADMDPNSGTFSPIFQQKIAMMKLEAESSVPANSKRSNYSEAKMISDEVVVDDYKSFKKMMSRQESVEIDESEPPTDRVKHKRNSQTDFKQREKYSIKIGSFMTQNELKKTIENSKRKFFEDRVDEIKKSSRNYFGSSRPISSHGGSPTNSVKSDFFKDFKKLTKVCKTNIKSTVRMKKNITKKFGDFKKTFGKMDRLMTDRDVEFETQLKKDIKHDLVNFNPNVVGLLRGKPGSVAIGKRDCFY